MKLKYAIVACNDNRAYLHFWPMVYSAWTRINVVPYLVLIANKTPDDLQHKDNIVCFSPLQTINNETVSTIWTAQTIRIYYPSILSCLDLDMAKDGILISDMDILPLNHAFFHESIQKHADNTFFCYRDVLRSEDMIPICYNVASQNVWRAVNKVTNLVEVRETMIDLYQKTNNRWTTDQETLWKMAQVYPQFESRTDDLDPKFTRLDRADIQDGKEPTDNQIMYGDFHMLRPADEHSEQNRKLFERYAMGPTTRNMIQNGIKEVSNDPVATSYEVYFTAFSIVLFLLIIVVMIMYTRQMVKRTTRAEQSLFHFTL